MIIKLLNCIRIFLLPLTSLPSHLQPLVWKATIRLVQILKSGIWSPADHSAETLLSSYTAYCVTISHVQDYKQISKLTNSRQLAIQAAQSLSCFRSEILCFELFETIFTRSPSHARRHGALGQPKSPWSTLNTPRAH